MTVRVEGVGHVGVELHANKVTTEIFPNWQRLVKVSSGTFHLSKGEPMEAFASACTIVALQRADGRWGLYHGVFHRKEEMRRYRGYSEKEIARTQTLEDFLNAWNTSRHNTPTETAYLFARGFLEDESEQAEHRQEAINLVKDRLCLPDESVYIKWNDHFEGETDIIVDPVTSTIKINHHFWDMP